MVLVLEVFLLEVAGWWHWKIEMLKIRHRWVSDWTVECCLSSSSFMPFLGWSKLRSAPVTWLIIILLLKLFYFQGYNLPEIPATFWYNFFRYLTVGKNKYVFSFFLCVFIYNFAFIFPFHLAKKGRKKEGKYQQEMPHFFFIFFFFERDWGLVDQVWELFFCPKVPSSAWTEAGQTLFR